MLGGGSALCTAAFLSAPALARCIPEPPADFNISGSKAKPRSPVLPSKISPAVDREVDMEMDRVDPQHKGDQITAGVALNAPVPDLEVRSSKRRGRKPAVVEASGSEDSDVPMVRLASRIWLEEVMLMSVDQTTADKWC